MGAGFAAVRAVLPGALLSGAAEARTLQWQASEGLAGQALRVSSEGDGVAVITEVAGRQAVRNRGDQSLYLYFALPDDVDPANVYVTVEFYDQGWGAVELQYDGQQAPGAPLLARYHPAEDIRPPTERSPLARREASR